MMFNRRTTLLLGASALVAACSGGGSSEVSAADMTIQAANAGDAPMLIEYASTTCPHCAEFHEQIWPQVKANFVDTGRIRFVFREYPTPPANIAVAMFQVARCGGASSEQYFDRLGVLFAQQRQIFATGSIEGVRAKLIEIGGASGLSAEQVNACIADEGGAARIRQVVADAERYNVTGTPTFILNDEKIEIVGALTYDSFAAALEAKLAG